LEIVAIIVAAGAGTFACGAAKRTPLAKRVHQQPVVHVCGGWYGVDVGDEATRRLRLADREHSPWFQSAEHDGAFTHAAGLREDVVREAVTGMRKRRVAHRICRFGRRHADELGRDNDPYETSRTSSLCASVSRIGVDAPES